MLILFDIDGTLYQGNGSGRAAFLRAGRKLFGESFSDERVSYAGRLDPVIFGDLLVQNGYPNTPETIDRARKLIYGYLRENLDSGEFKQVAIPGSLELVRRLRQYDHITLGLLTGNWPETGRLKIASVGFDPDWFPISVWGDDGVDRVDLPPVGRTRYADQLARDIEFGRILIVGDTIHDVRCAKAHGSPALAIASGRYTRDELVASGADLVVDTFDDTDFLVEWILRVGEPASSNAAPSS